jgi:D-serine deaminase-like pyridoxal phosphate-dependent protein
MDHEYRYYRSALEGRLLPLAWVDLDKFDQNVEAIRARAQKRPICVASKSVRCVSLLKRIQAASPQFHSFMAFSVREALYLHRNGLDNILVAYPVWSEALHSPLCEVLGAGARITLMIDCEEHLEYLDAIGERHGCVIPVCIDLDMSSSFPGLHFGVRRSPVRSAEQAVALYHVSQKLKFVRIDGLMGYEAQIAGVQDSVPGNGLKNAVVRFLKKKSIREVVARRTAAVEGLRKAGCILKFVNGGGTGSIESTIGEDLVTEVTSGSGFYTPTLFDHYSNFKHQPAAGFALEIVRQPTDNIYTCHGGGYIASGPAGPDRLPRPSLPHGCALLPLEGAGEVQTPVLYNGSESLSIGAPIFFRHSKAGELCERFNSLHLISKGAIVDEVNTYRGDGQCFL